MEMRRDLSRRDQRVNSRKASAFTGHAPEGIGSHDEEEPRQEVGEDTGCLHVVGFGLIGLSVLFVSDWFRLWIEGICSGKGCVAKGEGLENRKKIMANRVCELSEARTRQGKQLKAVNNSNCD